MYGNKDWLANPIIVIGDQNSFIWILVDYFIFNHVTVVPEDLRCLRLGPLIHIWRWIMFLLVRSKPRADCFMTRLGWSASRHCRKLCWICSKSRELYSSRSPKSRRFSPIRYGIGMKRIQRTSHRLWSFSLVNWSNDCKDVISWPPRGSSKKRWRSCDKSCGAFRYLWWLESRSRQKLRSYWRSVESMHLDWAWSCSVKTSEKTAWKIRSDLAK